MKYYRNKNNILDHHQGSPLVAVLEVGVGAKVHQEADGLEDVLGRANLSLAQRGNRNVQGSISVGFEKFVNSPRQRGKKREMKEYLPLAVLEVH